MSDIDGDDLLIWRQSEETPPVVTNKERKHDVMGPHNLYMLLADRLLLHSDHISLSTYNVLYEILTEHVSSQILYQKHPEPESHYRLENPMILKVIATLIRQSKPCEELMETKKLFLSDMTLLCNNNKENRRTVLQMSVWQEWLIAMAYIHPQNAEEQKLSDMVYSLFRMLLHHAIKYEYGGWRVWVDTLAIVHSKVSFEEFKLQFSQMYEQYEQRRSDHLTDPALRKQKPISTISGLDNNNHRALNIVNPPRPDIVHKDSDETELKQDSSKSVIQAPLSYAITEKESNLSSNSESTNATINTSSSSLLHSHSLDTRSSEKSVAVQASESIEINKNYNSSLCEALLTTDDHRPVPVSSEATTILEALPIEPCATLDETNDVNMHENDRIPADTPSPDIELESVNKAKLDADSIQTNSPGDSGFMSLSMGESDKAKSIADDEVTCENEMVLDDESIATGKSPDELPLEILGDEDTNKYEDAQQIQDDVVNFENEGSLEEKLSHDELGDIEKDDEFQSFENDSPIHEGEIPEAIESDTKVSAEETSLESAEAEVVTDNLSHSPSSLETSTDNEQIPEVVDNNGEISDQICEEQDNSSSLRTASPDVHEHDVVANDDTEMLNKDIDENMPDHDKAESEHCSENSSICVEPDSCENQSLGTSNEDSVVSSVHSPSHHSLNEDESAVTPEEIEQVQDVTPITDHKVEHVEEEIKPFQDETLEIEEDKSCPASEIVPSNINESKEDTVTENIEISDIKSEPAFPNLADDTCTSEKKNSPNKTSVTSSPVASSIIPCSVSPTVISKETSPEKIMNSLSKETEKDVDDSFEKCNDEDEIEKPVISTIDGQLEKERRLMAKAGGDAVDSQNVNTSESPLNKGSSDNASPEEQIQENTANVNVCNSIVSVSQTTVTPSETDVAPTRRPRSVTIPRKQTNTQVQRPKSMSLSQRPPNNNSRQMFNSGPTRPPFRIPEFRWSPIHQRLLSDLLFSLETDIQVWRSHTTKTVIDFVNSGENAIFVINTVHLISQVADNIIIACGGLLPLLASATSPNHELDVIEPTQGMSIEVAVAFLQRLVNMTDVLVFASSLSFSELEAEKNMSSGGILRQCLRLVCTSAVRNCLECRERSLPQTPIIPHPSANISRDASRPSPIQSLIGGVQPSAKVDFNIVENLGGQSSPIRDPEKLLQDMDVNRLRAVIYRDVDETKQAQFLALAVVYFISVLMVSKYRDILEPPPPPPPQSSSFSSRPAVTSESSHYSSTVSAATTSSAQTVTETEAHSNGQEIESTAVTNEDTEDEVIIVEDTDSSILAHLHSSGAPVPAVIRTQKLKDQSACKGAEIMVNGASGDSPRVNGELTDKELESESVVNLTSTEDNTLCSSDSRVSSSDPSIMSSSIAQNGFSRTMESVDGCTQSRAEDIHLTNLGGADDFHILSSPLSREATLTQKLESALGSVCPLLREIMLDFAPFLSRTLVGSHGQDLLMEGKGLCTFKNSTSVVELVMLLCSQEWQNSLQKHAGLAFIELINEGRLLSHAMKDHIVRVANEAEFILNRMRADDVLKHADFETLCAQTLLDRKEEEKMCDHLITAARRRDSVTACRNIEKILNILTNKHGAWGSKTNAAPREFLKLDSWEDDARRRKRFVQNPYGSSHPEATLKAAIEHGAPEDAILQAREEFHQHLALTRRQQQHHLQSSDLLDDSDLWDDKDLDAELAGPVSFSTKCKLIAPGVVVPGMLSITQAEMFFEVDEDDAEYKKMDPEVIKYCDHVHGKWHFSEIRAVFSRRYLLQNVALEIFLASRTSIMLAFLDHMTVKKVVKALPCVGVGIKYGIPQTRRASLMSPRQIFQQSNMTQKWQRREITNFEYLMFLNTIAGRTYNDLNQYPVFPWVLTNYEAPELDLSLPSNYRDLSKPVGALNPSRKAFFEERYETWEHETIPPFHFGTHYSTSAFTLNWLVRVEPFTTMFLSLQGGKFDHANRMFSSVAQAWKNCQRDTSDVKELIPEFFYLAEMFINKNGYQLGCQEEGTPVNDVILPPWASTPEEFVRINRMALESEFVSCQLHQWIDLIFGYKQRGPEAVRATNVFYYLTYEGSVDLENMKDQVMKEAIENQIRNFGQTPSQLLMEPHPPRSSAMHISPMMFSPITEEVCMIMKFLSNSPICHISANTYPQLPLPSVVTISCNQNFAVNRWNPCFSGPLHQPPYSDNSQTSPSQLPLAMDPLLIMNVAPYKRHLGDNFSQRVKMRSCCFVTTVDSRFLIACGFWDNSFRVFSTESAKIVQIVYGHFGVVTCLARSECNITSDCYIASGSEDCTILLWHWNARTQCIAGDLLNCPDVPTPRATLTGHESEITCIVVSAELGLVVSGSKDGPVLVHTTNGDLLRSLEAPESFRSPELCALCREGLVVVCYDQCNVCCFTINGRRLRSETHHHPIQCLTMSRDGEYMMTGSDKGIVEVWRTFNLALLYAFSACDSGVRSLALSHDQKFLLAGLANGSVTVFYIDFNRWHHEFQQRY